MKFYIELEVSDTTVEKTTREICRVLSTEKEVRTAVLTAIPAIVGLVMNLANELDKPKGPSPQEDEDPEDETGPENPDRPFYDCPRCGDLSNASLQSLLTEATSQPVLPTYSSCPRCHLFSDEQLVSVRKTPKPE